MNSPLVISKESPRWLYEALRQIEDKLSTTSRQMGAVSRGEDPLGGGASGWTSCPRPGRGEGFLDRSCRPQGGY